MTVAEIILSRIKAGRENAVHKEELVRLTGLSERDVRRVVERLRIQGAAICSDENGYYTPATRDELAKYVKQETSRSRSIYRRTASARRQLKKMQELDEFDGVSLLDIMEGRSI